MKTKLRHLSDDAVLKRLSSLVHDERAKTVEIIENLAECHRRGIILRRGHGSVLQYCLKVLHLSEHAAYHRIYAMHCALRYPIILEMLRDGSVNLTTIRLLGPHLRRDNHLELLNEARHKSKFEVMKLVARINPNRRFHPRQESCRCGGRKERRRLRTLRPFSALPARTQATEMGETQGRRRSLPQSDPCIGIQ